MASLAQGSLWFTWLKGGESTLTKRKAHNYVNIICALFLLQYHILAALYS